MNTPNGLRIFGAAVALLVAAVVVTGLFISGSPQVERERRFDGQRSSDLQQISSAVDAHYERTGRLPASLGEMASGPDKPGYVRSFTDPETNDPYGYRVTGDTTYEVCATFLQPSIDPKDVSRPIAEPFMDPWRHDAGPYCFQRNALSSSLGSICNARKPCPEQQTCTLLPGATDAICVAAGQECAAAGCPQDRCEIMESYPVQIRCAE